MHPRTRHTLRVASLLVASVVGASSDALAQRANQQVQRDTRQWYEAYDEGVDAVGRQQWQAAVNSLLAAKNLRMQQARRIVFYGDRAGAYIPDYYLGVAYLGLGRFAEADAAFDRVTQGKLVVQGDGPYAQFQQQAARAKGEATVTRAIQAADAGRLDQARQDMAAAQQLGVPDARLKTILDTISAYERSTLVARNDPPPQANPPATGGATAPEPAAPPPVNTPTPAPVTPSPAPPPANTPVSTAAVLVPQVLALAEKDVPNALARAQLRVGRVTRSAARTTAAPGTVLFQAPLPGSRVPAGTRVDLVIFSPAAPGVTEVDGVRAFLAGDYATAAQTLETVIARPPGAANGPTPRGRLYLATSLAALVLVGDRERTELEAARQQLGLAGRLDRFAADRRLISPRIWSALGVTQP